MPIEGRDDSAVARAAAIAPSLRLAARRFGTPLYLTDLAALEAAAADLALAFPDPWIRQFSVKANDVPAIVGAVTALGLGANVVSRGEWSVARRAGVPNAAVTLEGIGKTPGDLAAAVRAARDGRPLRWVSLESTEEAEALAALAIRAGLGRAGARPIDVLLRLNPDVAPETHAGLAVGSGASKFGMDETELTAVVNGLPPSVRARGIHVHVGSQLGAVDAWRDAARRAIALVALVRPARPDFDTVDLGGGFPVRSERDSAPSPERFAREIPPILDATPSDRRPRRLAVEPGRFVVAQAGWLVARVLHARIRTGPLVVLDTGMTELVRPALYGAVHPIVALTSGRRPVDPSGTVARPDTRSTSVHGPVCESTDTLGEHDLPPLVRGDLVAIGDAGAYAASMAMSYNGRPRPIQVTLDANGTLRVARRRGRLVPVLGSSR